VKGFGATAVQCICRLINVGYVPLCQLGPLSGKKSLTVATMVARVKLGPLP